MGSIVSCQASVGSAAYVGNKEQLWCQQFLCIFVKYKFLHKTSLIDTIYTVIVSVFQVFATSAKTVNKYYTQT